MKGSVSPENTPERALAHDEQCEKNSRTRAAPMRWRCRCFTRALTAARQREEEAKGEVARLKATGLEDVLVENARLAKEHNEVHDWNMRLVGEHYALGDEIKALRAENAQLQAQDEVHWKTRRALLKENDRLTRAASEKDGQIAAWIDTAAQESRNRDYYRALVVEIGELFGVAARTADDGGIDDDVLCAKVPELVRAQALAASESARTLQVEIAQLQADIREHDLDREGFKNMALEKAAQVTALREAIGKGMNAPSGTPICLCHNHNAVLSQRERPCWYCEVRAVLAEQGWASFHASEETAARVILERNRYQMALQSIAANTCCDRCQEAALVAAAALAALPQDGA